MGAFEKFQEMVSAGLSTLGEGHELIQLARNRYGEAQTELARLVADGAGEPVKASLARLDQIVAALDQAILWRGKGLDEFGEYLELVGARGSQGAKGNVGDQVTAPKLKSGDLEKELSGADDGDSEMSKKRRIGRGLVRNSESIEKQTANWTKNSGQDRSSIDLPPPGETYSGTGHATTPDPGPAPGQPVAADIATTIAVVGIAGFSLAARYWRTKKEKQDG